ncbi:MAG: SsrA-binding protein SmpB [Desulfovibrionaceae bacterium]
MNTKPKKVIAQNRKARMLYEILDTYEAGIVLQGSEVKSIRAGKVSFVDSFVDVQEEAFLMALHIAVYSHAGYSQHEPTRKRKLLLHRKELLSLQRKIDQKGLTVIPLSLYFRANHIKVEICLARGKKLHDRRKDLKERAEKRDLDREMSKQ